MSPRPAHLPGRDQTGDRRPRLVGRWRAVQRHEQHLVRAVRRPAPRSSIARRHPSTRIARQQDARPWLSLNARGQRLSTGSRRRSAASTGRPADRRRALERETESQQFLVGVGAAEELHANRQPVRREAGRHRQRRQIGCARQAGSSLPAVPRQSAPPSASSSDTRARRPFCASMASLTARYRFARRARTSCGALSRAGVALRRRKVASSDWWCSPRSRISPSDRTGGFGIAAR